MATFAAGIGTSKQNMVHWRTRGIPAKFMRPAAEYLGRSVEWLEFGEEVPMSMPKAVAVLAAYLQDLPDYDRATVIALLTTLVHSPQLHGGVAQGLLDLAEG